MKPGIPWSVKGINTEAKEAAKQAARRSGVTLGEWLNSMILDQADTPDYEPAPRRPQGGGQAGDFQSKLGELAEQLARLADLQQDTTAGQRHEQERHPSPEADSRALQDLLSRIETNERNTIEALATVNERLSALATSVPERAIQRPEDVPGFRALESALRNIVNHVEVTEKRTREDVKSLQERLVGLTQSLDRTQGDSDIDARIADLIARIERTENAALNELPSIIENEFGKIGQRIDQARQSSEASALKAQAAAIQTASKEVRDVENRFQAFMREQKSAMQGRDTAAGDMQQLRGEIESLNQRIDDLKADAASERDLHSLRAAFEQLSTRVAQGPDLRPLADLDRRLADIASRVEQHQGADPRALAALEGRIATMSDRIGKAEAQLGHLASLEQSINQLFDSLEQSRLWARDMAEDAASRMADKVMKSPQFTQSQPPPGPSPELKALEQGLQAVKASAAASDKRNQETLEAVHETLEQIVSRLAEMEERGTPVAEPPARAAAPEQSSIWQDTIKPSPARETYRATQPIQETPRAPPPAPDLANPFEFGEPQQPAAMRNDTIAPEMPETPPFEPFQAGGVDDYIAAARRAAQAAAQQAPGPVLGKPSLLDRGKAEPVKRRFSFPFPFLTRKNGDAAPQVVSSTGSPVDTKRRNLLIAGLMLMVAAAGYVASNYIPDYAPPPPPTNQQSNLARDHTTASRKAAPAQPADQHSATSAKANAAGDEVLANVFPVSRDLLPPQIQPASLRTAAENGDPEAQFVVAGRYLDGKTVPQDETKAAQWYQKAAARGLAPAQYRVGTLFERGRGVPRDNAMARTWYERAAILGNVKSMHNAAVIYAGNEAGPPDYGKAARWFTEASEYGLKDSQFNLAVLYERGLGVKRSSADALFWYSIAARQADADAAAKAKSLEKVLAPSTVSEVRNRIATWTPRAPTAEANMVKVSDPAWQTETTAAAAKAYEMPLLGAAMDMAATGQEAAPAAEEPQKIDPIQETQQLLNDLGFDAGTADGRMGTRTTNAIRLFQLQSGMKVTGEVSDDLIAKLRSKRG